MIINRFDKVINVNRNATFNDETTKKVVYSLLPTNLQELIEKNYQSIFYNIKMY